jgi:nucleotidyltransferase substrate binding protein (TIGR01987 family)
MEQDIRWVQRFSNYKKAFLKLKEATNTVLQSELELEGLIQRFEYTYELAWKTLKDYLEHNGFSVLRTPAEVQQKAFEAGLISNGISWRKMAEGRNMASHEYNEEKIHLLASLINHDFILLLEELYLFLLSEEAKLL